ncbi:MAG: transglutaminase-like domain-containing protein [Stenotrophobium sp.]
MNDSILSQWREARGGTNGVTALVLTAFLWMQLYPVAAAAKDAIQGKNSNAASAIPARFAKATTNSPAADPQRATMEALQGVLRGMHAALKHHRDLIIKRKGKDGVLHLTILGTKADVDLTADRQEIAGIKQQLALQDQQAEAGFRRDDQHIKAHHLPAVIQQRHDDAVAKYQKNRDEFQKGLDALASSQDLDTLLSQSDALLKSVTADLPQHAKFDPKNLPFRTADSKVREPATTPAQLKRLLAAPAGSSARASQGPALPMEARKQDISATELALIKGNGQPFPYPGERHEVMVASLGSLAGLMAMGVVPPTPDDLTPTEDVQITPAIQALATQLHNNPVEIYNWVHNNIEYLPSYGSIQGSQLTLDKKQGNAFDTSSLLIALLRASNIPSRYVYGTIEIPAAQVNNWVGGTTNPDATQQLLGQGGIPNSGLTSGGQTVAIRMEQVWVEAWVDAYPSRGAKNTSPNAWMPMDASYKQYTYTQGMNLQQAVPFDAQGFVTSAQQGATVDATNGYVQNLNQTNIQSALSSYQTNLQNYINNQKPNATVGDVLGAKTIQALNSSTLPTGLPYRVDVRGNVYGTLPTSLRHQFQYGLYADAQSLSLQDPIFQYQASTPSLAEKKITLVFVPATANDAQTIESYLPKPHSDGSPIQPSEYPKSLPAYQINVIAELRVEGQTVATGGTFNLGQTLLGEGGFTNMNLQGWDLTTDDQVVGQSSSLGLSLQGISAAQLSALQMRLQNTQSQLQANQLAGLTGENFSGDLLTSNIWSYFVSIEAFGRIAQNQSGMVDVPGLSYGFFHAQLAPIQTYGVTASVQFPGVVMDVGHERRLAYSKDNSTQEWVRYNRLRGQQASAMEAEIPRQYFTRAGYSDPPKGITAVAVLATAATQGQKIYTITQTNQNQLSNIQQSSSVMTEISNAINAGNEVTVSQQPVTISGWAGAGYIVTDPQTGAGGYLIEGGSRGGDEASAAWDFVAAGLSGLVDALVDFDKANSINSALPYEEPTIAGLAVTKFSNGLNLLALFASIVETVFNPKESSAQKVENIIVNTGFSIVGTLIGEAVGSLFLASFFEILMFTVVIDLIIQLYAYDISLLIGYYKPSRKRLA